MILMGNLPFRVASGDFTQRLRKCQLFLLFDDAAVLCREARGKSSASQQNAIISPPYVFRNCCVTRLWGRLE